MAVSQDGCVLVPQVGEEFDSFDVLQTRVFDYGKNIQFVTTKLSWQIYFQEQEHEQVPDKFSGPFAISKYPLSPTLTFPSNTPKRPLIESKRTVFNHN